MPYKMIEGVYTKENYDHNHFPVFRREHDNLLFYYMINRNGVHFLVFGFGLEKVFGVVARVYSNVDPTTWPGSDSLDRNDVFGGLVRDWMYYNPRENTYSIVPSSRSSPMIKAVCVDEDFRECNSDRVYLNVSFHDGSGNVLNDANRDYFSRKQGLFRNLRPVYEHSRRSWYLQYVQGYWVVTSSYTPINSEDKAYMRVKDSALRPEYITRTWSVHYSRWRDMTKLRVLCRGVTSMNNTCPLKPCHGKATCVYTSGNETLCLCTSGYTGVTCSINKQCPVPLPKVGRELNFAYSGRRPSDFGMSFCGGSYPSVRFSLCMDGSYSSYWSRQGMACGKRTSTENPTEDFSNTESFTTEDPRHFGTTTSATPRADQQINFDDNPAIVPAVLTVAILLQLLLPFVLWCCALCKAAFKEIGEEEDDETRKKEISDELEKKLQRVAKAEEKEDQDQGIQDCRRVVEEYQRENEQKEDSRKRGLYRNASLCRLFSMHLYFSFYLWLIFLVSCDATHCTQYGMILVHLRRFAIAMLVISEVIILIESLYSHELDYLENIMQDETAWEYIKKLHLIPPKIHMAVECYHNETRTRVVRYWDGYGNLQTSTETYQEKVVTYVDHAEFSYGSWVDVSKKELPVESWACLTRVKIDQCIEFGDQETQDDFARQEKEMLERNKPRDECTEFSWSKEIPTVEKRISAFVDLDKKPFWMRPMYFWIATWLLMTWPYRWLFRAKTAKNYYTLKKKMYKSDTPPREEDAMDAAIADLVNSASSSGPESVQPDISLSEMSSTGLVPCPPLNHVAGPGFSPYPTCPTEMQPNAYHLSGAVPMPAMLPPVPDSGAPFQYATGSVFVPYVAGPQPSAPPSSPGADVEVPVRNQVPSGPAAHVPLNPLNTAEAACTPHPGSSASPAYPTRPAYSPYPTGLPPNANVICFDL